MSCAAKPPSVGDAAPGEDLEGVAPKAYKVFPTPAGFAERQSPTYNWACYFQAIWGIWGRSRTSTWQERGEFS